MFKTIAPGIDLYSFESLSSTQDQARIMVQEGFDDGTVILAKEQIMGRGRRGRLWVSETGNLFMTYIARPKCSVAMAAELSFVSCVAVGDGMRTLMGKQGDKLKYKWPNDMMLNGKKVGGILLETAGNNPDAVDAVMIGIGLNLQVFPEGERYPVTSFLAEGFDVVADNAAQAIAEYLQAAINMWQLQGFIPIKNRWMHHVYGMGKDITVHQGSKVYRGQMTGLDDSGALLMTSKLGAQDKITAGDVIFGDATTAPDNAV